MILLIGFMIGCEKGYPDEIPEWLKSEIKYRNKQEDRRSECFYCEQIWELQDTITQEYYYVFFTQPENHWGSLFHEDGSYAGHFELFSGELYSETDTLSWTGQYPGDTRIWMQKWEYR